MCVKRQKDVSRKNSLKKYLAELKKSGQLTQLKQLSVEERFEFIKKLIENKQNPLLSEEEIAIINLLDIDSFDINENISVIEEPDPLKLAVSTYFVYSMSRDGMETAFSSSKFASSEAYYKQIDRLYRVAKRLNGVQVIGAASALTYLLENSYLDDPRAMFYIDAPYLSADEDEKN